LSLCLVCAWTSFAYADEAVTSEKALQIFLQGYLKGEDRAVRYSAAPVSLDDKTPMRLVYILGRDWCGSGGCTALLLKPEKGTFKVVNRFTLARLPIHVLPDRTKGWHDITMPVRGGGVSYHIAVLRFNGSRYPGNPSLAPALPESANQGAELGLNAVGDPVYP
jgi:hypothetical protein